MKNTVATFKKMKNEGTKISMLTAYDYSTAKLVDEAGINSTLSEIPWAWLCSATKTRFR